MWNTCRIFHHIYILINYALSNGFDVVNQNETIYLQKYDSKLNFDKKIQTKTG